MEKQKSISKTVNLVFTAIALAMAVAVIVLNILKAVTLETSVLLLGIGLFGLAINALDKE